MIPNFHWYPVQPQVHLTSSLCSLMVPKPVFCTSSCERPLTHSQTCSCLLCLSLFLVFPSVHVLCFIIQGHVLREITLPEVRTCPTCLLVHQMRLIHQSYTYPLLLLKKEEEKNSSRVISGYLQLEENSSKCMDMMT